MPTTIDNLLSRMTLEEKIGQMILASIEVSRMDAGTREFLRKNHIGNVILFGKNCAGRAALAQLNAEIQHTVMAENGLPALIAIDQEGGCVTRLRNEATVFPSAMVIARTGDPANAYKVGRMMGGELRALGINLDCAPVRPCGTPLLWANCAIHRGLWLRHGPRPAGCRGAGLRQTFPRP